MKLYAIFDRIAGESGPLFEAKNHGVALRMYQGISLPGPADEFKLICLGSYSRDPVCIIPLKVPEDVIEMTGVEDEAVSSR